MKPRLCALLLVLAGASLSAGAAPPDESNLARIQQRVETQERDLRAVAGRLAELDKALRAEEQSLKELRARAADLTSEVKRVRGEVVDVEHDLGRIDARLREVQRVSLQRVRAVYMRRGELAEERLSWMRDSEEFLRNGFYLSKVRAFDAKLQQQLVQLRSEREHTAQHLRALAADRDLLQESLRQEEKRIATSVAEERRLRDSAQAEQQRMEKALTAMRAEALRLETVVRSLTTEEEPPRPSPKQRDVVAEHGRAGSKGYDGPGLTAGAVLTPVAGRVKRRFGKYKVEGFSDFVLSKGMEFAAPAGTAVSAGADGRVMYQGRMPGYGMIVILDHGKRFYSLYGRLAGVQATAGDDVVKGQQIASVGPPDNEGRNFYFEVRKNGTPVDPQAFLEKRRAEAAKPPGARRSDSGQESASEH